MDHAVLTIEEVARYLRINVRSVYKLVREGKLPGVKVLNKWRFDREQIEAWVKGEFGNDLKAKRKG